MGEKTKSLGDKTKPLVSSEGHFVSHPDALVSSEGHFVSHPDAFVSSPDGFVPLTGFQTLSGVCYSPSCLCVKNNIFARNFFKHEIYRNHTGTLRLHPLLRQALGGYEGEADDTKGV
ncbi:hypothetical protein Barb4_00822 [Bacteroidales bacterium Barb4]|nr:hypothetical protein Barb4_00822 [Bacteroidales bacterium Barb4]